jgi:hypothetical protein
MTCDDVRSTLSRTKSGPTLGEIMRNLLQEWSAHWVSAGLALSAALVAWGTISLCAADTVPARLEPIIRLDDGRVASCGVAITFGPGKPEVDLVNHRVADSTEFELTVRARRDLPSTEGPNFIFTESPTLATTSQDTKTLLGLSSASQVLLTPSRTPGATVTVSARGPVDPTQGAFLMQEFMVSGATVTFTMADRSVVSLTVPGPAPQNVRSAYLHCAGDLFPQTR